MTAATATAVTTAAPLRTILDMATGPRFRTPSHDSVARGTCLRQVLLTRDYGVRMRTPVTRIRGVPQPFGTVMVPTRPTCLPS